MASQTGSMRAATRHSLPRLGDTHAQRPQTRLALSNAMQSHSLPKVGPQQATFDGGAFATYRPALVAFLGHRFSNHGARQSACVPRRISSRGLSSTLRPWTLESCPCREVSLSILSSPKIESIGTAEKIVTIDTGDSGPRVLRLVRPAALRRSLGGRLN